MYRCIGAYKYLRKRCMHRWMYGRVDIWRYGCIYICMHEPKYMYIYNMYIYIHLYTYNYVYTYVKCPGSFTEHSSSSSCCFFKKQRVFFQLDNGLDVTYQVFTTRGESSMMEKGLPETSMDTQWQNDQNHNLFSLVEGVRHLAMMSFKETMKQWAQRHELLFLHQHLFLQLVFQVVQ